MSHIESLVESFWKPYHMLNEGNRPRLTKRVQNKVLVESLLNAADMLDVNSDEVKQLMKLMLPKKASDNESISFFNDYNKYNLGKLKHRTKTSPGKFFRKVFPSASDRFVEAFVSFYNNKILFDPDGYILHVGNTKEDFKRSFVNYCRTRGDFSFSGGSVSISDSCMRYRFDQFNDHPSVVYASGDFQVATIRTKKGKTRARVLIGIKDGVAMPNRIYASCNHSDQLLKDYLATLKTARQEWTGLKLLKIPVRQGNRYQFLCPYIDNTRYISVYDKDYLIVHPGNYESINSTSGSVYFDAPDREKTWVSNTEGKLR
jgi:hypothetical protein